MFQLCGGLSDEEYNNSVAVDPSSDHCFGNVIRHTVPITLENYKDNGHSFQAKVFLRSHDCDILCVDERCSNCQKKEISLQKSCKEKAAKEAQPVASKAPLTATGKERLVATIHQQQSVNNWRIASMNLSWKLKRQHRSRQVS